MTTEPTPEAPTFNPKQALDTILALLNENLPQAPTTRGAIVAGIQPHVAQLIDCLKFHGYKF